MKNLLQKITDTAGCGPANLMVGGHLGPKGWILTVEFSLDCELPGITYCVGGVGVTLMDAVGALIDQIKGQELRFYANTGDVVFNITVPETLELPV